MCAIKRGDLLFHCVTEAQKKFFSSVSDRELSDWLRFLSVEILHASDEENDFLKKQFTADTGPFFLISDSDLSRLLRFSGCHFLGQHSFASRGFTSADISTTIPLHSRNDNLASNDNSANSTNSNVVNARWQSKECTVALTPNSESDTVSIGTQFFSGGNVNSEITRPPQKRRDENLATALLVSASRIDNSAHCLNTSARSQSKQCSIAETSGIQNETDSEITAFSTENDQLEPTNTQCDTKTQCNEHFDARLGEMRSDTEVLAETDKRNEKRKCTVLTESEMTPELRSEIHKLRRFYSQVFNFDRQGSPLRPSTLQKIIQRISGYLWFAKNVKGITPGLSLCGNPRLVQEFVTFVTERRNLKPITASRYVSAFLSVVKVLNADEHSQSVNTISEDRLRAIQRQLETASRKERLAIQATKPLVEKKIVYPELLELCRELRWQLDELSGIEQARCGMNLSILLMYCSANPGRVKEYVTLRIYSGQSPEECQDQNFICFNEDDSVVLLENNYKTKTTYGPNRTELTELPFLVYYLKLYCQKFRPKLLLGNTHDFFFVNQKGLPFNETSYSNYISAFFEKHFSLKLTTNDLRKCVVDFFISLPQSGGDYALRESLAAVMKHSVRTQKKYYDERPLAVKKSRAISFLGSMTSRAIESDEIEILSNDDDDDDDDDRNHDDDGDDDDGFVDTRPSNGEFVALVASNSTITNPEVFVAKVLKFSQDRRNVFLAHFEEVEPYKFKLVAGKSYSESTKSIIYPVDIVYLYSSGVYELRTNKLDIHKQVRPNN